MEHIQGDVSQTPPCLTVVPTSGAGATLEDRRTGESTLNILPNSVHGEGAHGRSLRIVEAQGRVALRIYRHVRPPDVLEEGAQLPKRLVEWMLMFSQHRRPGFSTVRPFTRSLVFRHLGANEAGLQR